MNPLPSIKSTSGEGFSVEDAAVAFLAAHLLTGVSWVGAGEGLIQSIGCQLRQSGWAFDDVVLQLARSDIKWKCACSIKSGPVFGKEGAPREFVKSLWEQWLDRSGSGFQQAKDSITLFAAQHEPEIREAWIGLCDSARVISPEVLTQRCVSPVEPSPLRRAAFESLQLVGSTSGEPVEIARLLRAFRLAEHDFQHAESQSATHAILLCQQALEDAARDRAVELWDALVRYCVGIRRKGGQITLPDLLAELAHRFPLKQHPTYTSDWATILIESRQRMEALPMKIGGSISVERKELLQLLTRNAGEQSAVVVLGESGNGKSVLTRQWAGLQETVWLRAGDLATIGGLRALFRLKHGISELFSNVSRPLRLVLDGLDKCFDEAAFDEAALLLHSAFAAASRDRWQTLLTCCPEDWERVRRQLIRRGIHFVGEVVNVGRFSDSELRAVCEQVPSLRVLIQRPHLHPILRWPKALDIVATHWQAGDAPLNWATESDFAQWFWRSAICQDDLASFRDCVARKLAVQLADRMAAGASLDDFQRDEATMFGELAREGHIEIDPIRRTVRFAHELVADWARQRQLQVQGDRVSEFLRTRLHSPLWHRALLFHGLDLLENLPDSSAWEQLFVAFGGDSPVDEMAQNLLLEAPIFAARQRVVLDRLWPLFELNQGSLLRRFLRQFLRVATIPNEEMVMHFRSRSPELQLEAAVLYRLPWPPYWNGVLAFLGQHSDQVAELAPEQVADVCLLWLPLHGAIRFGMRDAAQLAVTAARRVYRTGERWHGSHRGTSPEEKICQALLAASPEMPGEVSELALKFSGRRRPDPEDGLSDDQHQGNSRSLHRLGPLVPWPEGPQCHGAEIFRKAFMSGPHAAPFMRALPDIAAEVMFAVFLSLPRATWHPRDHHGDLDEHGFNPGDFRGQSPLWMSGPFLTFLRINPSIALRAIIRLVNFATDRAYELGEDIRQHIEVPVTVDGETNFWRGHQFSYLWHQGHVFGPRAVGCALLSLEKWLYLLMDEKQPLDEYLTTILQQSRSVALAGVLISVGKREPELFLGALRPILEAIDFYWIEELLGYGAEGGYRASSFYERSEAIREVWREWVEMAHRSESIGRLALRMYFGNERWRTALQGFRQTWQARIDAATAENPAPPWLPRIASQFELANWRSEAHEGGTLISYQPPVELQPTPEALEQLKRSQLLTILPFRCRQVLMGEAECSKAQIAEWWSQLEVVRALPFDDQERGFRDAEDALCGVVAVAVVRHRDWLKADPRREQEALSILAAVGGQPPKPFWFVDDDFTDFKWDNFAAWALTTLWCERPDDPFLLQAVGALVLWDRNIVVSRVMTIAAGHRIALGERFDRLLAHTIRYGPARHRAQMERHTPEKTFDRDAWVTAHLEKFLAGKTEPLPRSWRALAEPRTRRGRRVLNVGRGVDIGHLFAALSWAEDLSSARDATERIRWLNFHRETLLCALARIENIIASPSDSEPWYSHQEDWPYEDERLLLERIATIVARLTPNENHRSLWEPIFALGCDGGRWVETFISHWFLEAAGHEEPSPSLIEQWGAMLSDADSSTAWKLRGHRPSASRDLWNYLLGLSPFSADFWSEKLAAAVEAVRAFHERWARAHASNQHDARSFIFFLKTRAARNLRVDGLRLLYETIPLENRYFWGDDDIRDAFARFLRLLQDEHWTEVIGDAAARQAFMSFALKLGALQHPLGSEVLTLAGARLGLSGH